MERTEFDGKYEIATLVARLRDRARRRLAVGLGGAAGAAAVVAVVAFALGVGSVTGTAVVFAVVLAVVFAIGAAVRALGGQFPAMNRIGPVGGLPFARRRRAYRGLRRGQLDHDPLLHEVQLVEARRLYDQRRNVWIFPILVVCWSAMSALGRSLTTTVFCVVVAILYAIVSTQVFTHLRGAKRILAAD